MLPDSGLSKIDSIHSGRRIVSQARQFSSRVLESSCQFDLTSEAQEYGTGIRWKTGDQVPPKARQVQLIFRDERSHSSAAFGGGNRHSVDFDVHHSRKCADRF